MVASITRVQSSLHFLNIWVCVVHVSHACYMSRSSGTTLVVLQPQYCGFQVKPHWSHQVAAVLANRDC
jgi:hypothetical protein